MGRGRVSIDLRYLLFFREAVKVNDDIYLKVLVNTSQAVQRCWFSIKIQTPVANKGSELSNIERQVRSIACRTSLRVVYINIRSLW